MQDDVTQLLHRMQAGDALAAEELMPLVYEQLRLLARRHMRSERDNHTLQPTAIVHDAYLKLATGKTQYTDRLHFYAVAARAMRQILTDWARTAQRDKRGGGAIKVELEEHHASDTASPDAVLDVSRFLGRLQSFDPRKAQVVELVFFGGMTYAEVAALLGVTEVTVHRDLKFAKAWMQTEMTKKSLAG